MERYGVDAMSALLPGQIIYAWSVMALMRCKLCLQDAIYNIHAWSMMLSNQYQHCRVDSIASRPNDTHMDRNRIDAMSALSQ